MTRSGAIGARRTHLSCYLTISISSDLAISDGSSRFLSSVSPSSSISPTPRTSSARTVYFRSTRPHCRDVYSSLTGFPQLTPLEMDSPPHLPHGSRKRTHASSPTPPRESCPSIAEHAATASSPARMIKKRKTLKRRETAFERRDDVSVGMEVEEEVDVVAGPMEKGEENAITDSGRMASPVVSPDIPCPNRSLR